MSRIELVLPRLGESVEEGTVTVWHVSEGQSVRAGDVLLEISTDKVETEIEAPADCTIEGIAAAEGTTVQVGERLAWLVTDPSADTTAHATAHASPTAEPNVVPSPAPATTALEPTTTPDPPVALPSPDGGVIPLGRSAPLSPVVRRLLAETDLRPNDIDGSGRNGRITKRDVLNSAGRRGATTTAPQQEAPATRTAAPAPRAHGSASTAVVEALEASVDLSSIDFIPDARTACLTFALLRALDAHPGTIAGDASIVVDGDRLDDPFTLRARALIAALAAAPATNTDAPVSIWDLADEPVARASFAPTASGALLSFTVSGPRTEIASTRSGGSGTIEFRTVSTIVASYRADRIERRTALEILNHFVRGIETIDWRDEIAT